MTDVHPAISHAVPATRVGHARTGKPYKARKVAQSGRIARDFYKPEGPVSFKRVLSEESVELVRILDAVPEGFLTDTARKAAEQVLAEFHVTHFHDLSSLSDEDFDRFRANMPLAVLHALHIYYDQIQSKETDILIQKKIEELEGKPTEPKLAENAGPTTEERLSMERKLEEERVLKAKKDKELAIQIAGKIARQVAVVKEEMKREYLIHKHIPRESKINPSTYYPPEPKATRTALRRNSLTLTDNRWQQYPRFGSERSRHNA
jgi:hypothetical protein